MNPFKRWRGRLHSEHPSSSSRYKEGTESSKTWAARRAELLLSGLRVNEGRMRANLDKLGGLTQSEHVMLELGHAIGKQHAHERIGRIAVDAFQNGKNFETELCRDPVVSQHLAAERIHTLLAPLQYLGQCPELARRTAAELKKRK